MDYTITTAIEKTAASRGRWYDLATLKAVTDARGIAWSAVARELVALLDAGEIMLTINEDRRGVTPADKAAEFHLAGHPVNFFMIP